MRGLPTAAVFLVLAAVQTGCGSSKSSSSSSSSQPSNRQVTAAQVQSCLDGKGLDVRRFSRKGGVVNFQAKIASTTSPMTVNLNVFPSAQAASTYFNREKDQ